MTAAGVDETERGQEPGRDAENENPGFRFAAFGISRHRLFRDGQGVTTLVGGIGCPLSCSWCINAVCRDPSYKPKIFTSAELYERLKIDDLYFEATNGGVTFGGGEPLLQAAFIGNSSDLSAPSGKAGGLPSRPPLPCRRKISRSCSERTKTAGPSCPNGSST